MALALGCAAVLATAWICEPSRHMAWLVTIGVMWVVPGLLALRRAYRDHPSRWAMALLFGPPLGYALSSLALLAIWCTGGRSAWWLPVASLAACGAAWGTPSLGRRIDVPRYGRRDVLAVGLLLLLVPAVVARPYAKVGADLPEGRAYRAYFTADFVWAMSVVSEVGKGDVLPRNPYHLDLPLHYYWLAHLLPAVEHRTLGRAVRLDHLLLADAVLSAAMFVAFLYGLSKHVARGVAPAAIGCVLAVLASSPEGAYALADLARQSRPLTLVRYLNIDAVSRWIFGALPIDGLQRLLLYQPQHQIGYALAITAVLVMAQQVRHPKVRAAWVAGVLLGTGLLISTFSALMGAVMAAVIGGVAVVRARAWRVALGQAAAACVPLATAVWLSRVLAYVATDGQAPIVVGPNLLATRRALVGPVISLGPWLFVLLVAGAALWQRRRRLMLPQVLLPAVAVAVAVFFYYFVDVRDHQDVYVGWRAGHFVLITTAGLAGWVWWRILRTGRRHWRPAGAAAFMLYLIATLPTVAIDLYNTQDLSNRQEAAGFPWTLVLGHDEVNALRWIAANTPPDARVQVDAVARDPGTWAYIPAFAERRMSGGLPISMIPLAPYESISRRVRAIYQSTDPQRAFKDAQALRIDVLVVGQPEEYRHPGFRSMLDANPRLFPALFRTRNITLYATSGRMRNWLTEHR